MCERPKKLALWGVMFLSFSSLGAGCRAPFFLLVFLLFLGWVWGRLGTTAIWQMDPPSVSRASHCASKWTAKTSPGVLFLDPINKCATSKTSVYMFIRNYVISTRGVSKTCTGVRRRKQLSKKHVAQAFRVSYLSYVFLQSCCLSYLCVSH